MPMTTEEDATKKTGTLSQHLSKLKINKGGSGKEKRLEQQQHRASDTASTSSRSSGEAGMGKSGHQSEQQLSAETITLPQSFMVKYLGKRDARGLWGIKHTRTPVDEMVAAARVRSPELPLPILQLTVTSSGVSFRAPRDANIDTGGDLAGAAAAVIKRGGGGGSQLGPFPIDSVSYGVQDLVCTRVFAMIVVGSGGGQSAFQCYAFVCSSRQAARTLTFALARAFQDFSKTLAKTNKNHQNGPLRPFAIDLRTPEQIEEDAKREADSEA